MMKTNNNIKTTPNGENTRGNNLLSKYVLNNYDVLTF